MLGGEIMRELGQALQLRRAPVKQLLLDKIMAFR